MNGSQDGYDAALEKPTRRSRSPPRGPASYA